MNPESLEQKTKFRISMIFKTKVKTKLIKVLNKFEYSVRMSYAD